MEIFHHDMAILEKLQHELKCLFLFVSGSHSLVCSQWTNSLICENTSFSSQIPQIQHIPEEIEKHF